RHSASTLRTAGPAHQQVSGRKPHEIAMRRGGNKVFDVRHLPQIKQKHRHEERPERLDPLNPNWNPFAREDPASLVTVPDRSGPAPAATNDFDGLHYTEDCNGTQCGTGHPPDTNGDVGPTYFIETMN